MTTEEEGAAAFWALAGPDANPYEICSTEWRDWDRAWWREYGMDEGDEL